MATYLRSELVGRSSSKSALLECAAKSISLNLTGNIDYNSLGSLDNIGLQPVSPLFVDNFIVSVVVPDYNIENGKFLHVGAVNKAVREVLDLFDLEKCSVKAICCKQISNASIPHIKVFFPREDVPVQRHYLQEYKVATSNVSYTQVMELLRFGELEKRGFILRDFDCTMDFSGSFNKSAVIEHLIKNCGFRLQGEDDGDLIVPQTILDNDHFVGCNCLTYMETVNGYTTRQKLYNKMVQMLESQSVRSSIGCHWRDWAVQEGSILAEARDSATKRGLTRVEVTFYVAYVDCLPTDTVIRNTLDGIVNHVPESLVYSTPFSSTWEVYCNTFLHSLVCIHDNLALLVYSYNEVTRKISGQLIENYSKNADWIIRNNTLNGNLPVDIVEITQVREVEEDGKKDFEISVAGDRFFKSDNGSMLFETRLVSKKGLFSWSKKSEAEAAAMIQHCGMIPHKNCVPIIATKAANTNSKVSLQLNKTEPLTITLQKKKKEFVSGNVEERLFDEAGRIERAREPLFLVLGEKRDRQQRIEKYSRDHKNSIRSHLYKLEQGTYSILSAKYFPHTEYGERFQLVVEVSGELVSMWSNWYLSTALSKLRAANPSMIDPSRFLVQMDGPIGKVTIKGRSLNRNGYYTIFCDFVPTNAGKEPSGEASSATDVELLRDAPASLLTSPMTAVPREQLIPYKECPSLIEIPVGSVNKVESIGWLDHYGKKRLVVSILGRWYQGGSSLESQSEKLTKGVYVKIDKLKRNISTKRNEAVVLLVQYGEWHLLVDYKTVQMYERPDGTTKVIDVKEVTVNGQKRKLLLAHDGRVLKLRKSNLESNVKPGYV